MVAVEMRKATAAMVIESTTSTFEETIEEVIQIGYTFTKEGIRELIFNLVGKAHINVV